MENQTLFCHLDRKYVEIKMYSLTQQEAKISIASNLLAAFGRILRPTLIFFLKRKETVQ